MCEFIKRNENSIYKWMIKNVVLPRMLLGPSRIKIISLSVNIFSKSGQWWVYTYSNKSKRKAVNSTHTICLCEVDKIK